MTWHCYFCVFFFFYHGKSPSNHHLVEYLLLFPTTVNKSKMIRCQTSSIHESMFTPLENTSKDGHSLLHWAALVGNKAGLGNGSSKMFVASLQRVLHESACFLNLFLQLFQLETEHMQIHPL